MGARGQMQGDSGVMSGPLLKDEGGRRFRSALGVGGKENIPEIEKVMHKSSKRQTAGHFWEAREGSVILKLTKAETRQEEQTA